MGGVIETLRIQYVVDVTDKATAPMLAGQRKLARGTTQISKALTQQDAAVRRSGAVAQHVSRRRVSALNSEVTAVRRAAAANDKLAASSTRASRAQRRASSEPGIVRRAAASGRGTVRGAVGGVSAVVSIASAKQAVGVTEELAKTTLALNKNLGLGVVQASRWAAVARARGIDSKALNQAFGTLSKNIGAANRASDKHRARLDALGSSQKDQAKREELIAKGAGDQVAAFEKLGISQKELRDNDFDATLKRAADGIAAMPAGAERTALAMKLFGKGWQTITPVLRGGSKAMDEQLRLADKYGVTFKGKTIKSLEDLIAAQREAKFASMGLQVAFGTHVAPALTKAIAAGSGFVREMREGTGAGGRFAKQAKGIASDLRPVGQTLKSVGKFLAEHPRLVLAAAGAYAAFKATRGTLRIVRDIRDIGGAISSVRDRAAKSKIAHHLADGARGAGRLVKRALGGVRGVIESVMGTAGRRGGAAAAESIAATAGAQMGPSLDRHQKKFRGGRWSTLGQVAGRSLGRGLMVGVLLALPSLISEVQKKITEGLGLGEGMRKFGERLPSFGSMWRGLTGKRRGGVVQRARRFQHGGLVPIMASGGELLVDRGRAAMIPGPSDRDGTPMLARPGSAVLTGDGQARMAMGASLAQAVRDQAPHFARGGVVPGRYVATSYGPPWGGIQGTGITSTRVNLKSGPRIYGIATDPRMIALGSKVFAHPNPFGYTGRFSAFDTGGAIKGRRIDFYDWRGRRRQNAWGRRAVTISRARIAPRRDGEDTYRAPGGGAAETSVTILGRSRRRAGLLGDAFEQGRALGQAGLTRAAIKREGNPITRAIKEALAGAGTQPDKGGTARKAPADSLADGGSFPSGTRLARMHAKAAAIDAKRYQYAYGGGHGRLGIPGVGPRTPRGGKRGLGYDCSGAVSAVLGAGGLLRSPLTSGGLMGWGQKGSGKNLAVYTDPGHVIMRIGRRYFGTGEANPNGGAGWLPRNTMKGRGVIRTKPLGSTRKRTPPRRTTGTAADGGATRGPARRLGFRAGGIVGRFTGGGLAPPAPGRALTGALERAMTFAGGSFDALAKLIERSAEQRLLALRRQIAAQVQKGGPKKVVDRLRGVLDSIDGELGRRVGRIQDVVEERTRGLDRGRGAVERSMRARGVDAGGSRGIRELQAQQAAETMVRQQNVTSLQAALRKATRVKNRDAVREITQQVHDAHDELAESLTRQIELWREGIRAAGSEAVGASQFVLGLTQTGVAGLEAQQRLAGTSDTAEGMRQRAGAIAGGVIPALQAALAGHQFNAAMLAGIGDVDGWRQAIQDAAASTVEIANAQADAADLMREAAARFRQDAVDSATHIGAMADKGFQRLGLQQRLAGTYDSAGGAQERAAFVREKIIPTITVEIAALFAQRIEAEAAGNATLARQIAEAIADKENESLQAQVDSRDILKDIAGDLKEFGGSTAFSYRGQTEVDVIRARVGA